jgi:hypothetical protein
MGFDRSKYKTTSADTLDKQAKEQQEKRPKGGNSNYAGWHKIEDGVNKFRFFPFHPDGGGESFMEARTVSWLEVNRPKRDENKKIIEGEFELQRMSIFNAKVHGGLPNDPVELYMEVAKHVAIPAFTGDSKDLDGKLGSDKAKQIWNTICGYSDKSGQFHPGVKPSDTWVVYAAKLEKDGSWKLNQLELKKTVCDQLSKLAMNVTEGTNPDPFTDPADGYVIKITKSGSKLGTKYDVSIDDVMVSKTQRDLVILPLTDEQLQEFEKLPSLHKMYVNSYKQSDFDMQIDGLQRFDAQLTASKIPIEVFGREEFLDGIEQLSQLVSPSSEEEVKEEKKPEPPKPTVSKPSSAKELLAKRAATQTTTVQTTQTVSVPTQVVETSTEKASANKLADIRAKYGKK